ncbi:hypothetical protein [Aestuariirhabdus haliotis]|nr:hypothetical protein [Aestuariirhabdus haliotis]MCL6421244.1 hypothetical protein [Aestuariirhabdus haliotis]
MSVLRNAIPALLISSLFASVVVSDETPSVKDFRFPRPDDQLSGEVVNPSPVLEPRPINKQPPARPTVKPQPVAPLKHSSTVTGTAGAIKGRTDGLGQAIDPGGRMLGPVDSLGQVIEPGTGAIRGQVPAGGQPRGPYVK